MAKPNAHAASDPAPSWLNVYPPEYHDVLLQYGMAAGTEALSAEFNERVMEIADYDLDDGSVRSWVDAVYAEMFGDGPDNPDA